MDAIPVDEAKDQLEDLMLRAARGEDITIVDGEARTFKLTQVAAASANPTKPKRQIGHLEGVIPPPPDDFFDPMSEEELKDWYGDDT